MCKKIINVNTKKESVGKSSPFSYIQFIGRQSTKFVAYSEQKKLMKELEMNGQKFTRMCHFGTPVLIVHDLAMIEELMRDTVTFIKDLTYRPFYWVGNENVLFLNGEKWKLHRRIVNASFGKLYSFKNAICDEVDVLLKKFEDKDIKIQEEIQKLTMSVLGKVIFAEDNIVQKEVHEKYLKIVNFSREKFLYTFKYIIDLPFKITKAFLKDVDDFNRFLKDWVEQEKKKGSTKGIVASLAEAYFKNEISFEEVRSNITILYIAGNETTLIGIEYMLYMLTQHLDLQKSLREQNFTNIS
jgi:cytochrome P450